MSKRVHSTLAIGSAFTVLAIACSGSSTPPAQQGAPPQSQGGAAAPAAAVDKADGPGVITGTMTFAGTPPRPRRIPMDADPLCKGDATSESLLVAAGGGVRDVFVYVKDGLGQRRYAVPADAVRLDQKGCRYVPHVFGVQAGQTFHVSNSDPAMHNVHAMPTSNTEFNLGQPAGVPPVPRRFDKPEIMVPIRCDVHSWMISYAGVTEHPFFAVTKDDGSFEIKGLPAGTYTIGAWHEQLGEQTQSVTVDGATPAKLSIVFKAPPSP
jgi:hypothetical protein